MFPCIQRLVRVHVQVKLNTDFLPTQTFFELFMICSVSYELQLFRLSQIFLTRQILHCITTYTCTLKVHLVRNQSFAY